MIGCRTGYVEEIGIVDGRRFHLRRNALALSSPGQGWPIVLLADRQTTGGYAKIATVCSFDIPKLVQGKPGDTVCFRKITLEEAQKINEGNRRK